MYNGREIGEVWEAANNRNYIKQIEGIIPYAVYIAKNNPEICGDWFEGCEVHHINGIENDDRPENLIVLDSKTHHLIHTKSVDAFFKGKYMGRYTSITKASEELGIPCSVISFYCKHQKPISSTYKYWRFKILNA